MSGTATTHQSIDTVYNADSVEWCPALPHQGVVLCGTYQLEEENQEVSYFHQSIDTVFKMVPCPPSPRCVVLCETYQLEEGKHEASQEGPQVRIGRLYTYTLDRSDNGNIQLREVHHMDMPGILDIKWSYHTLHEKTVFALVNSVGQLRVFSLQDDKSVALVTETDLSPGSLGLSLEWNNMLGARLSETRITSSDSAGNIHIHQLAESALHSLNSWKGHDFEAWITAFDQWNTDIVYTGGDDCRLKGWDIRTDSSTPIFNSKRHSMGVCSIQSNPIKENILATGSYDEQLVLWDTRNMKQPLSECGLGGGIWRIKWEPTTASHILTATMYNGFHVINTDNLQEPKITHQYSVHDSIGYGADWCRNSNLGNLSIADDLQQQNSNHVIATCSFYDHLLTLWTYSDSVP